MALLARNMEGKRRRDREWSEVRWRGVEGCALI